MTGQEAERPLPGTARGVSRRGFLRGTAALAGASAGLAGGLLGTGAAYADTWVEVNPGDDIQLAVDNNPEGTQFLLKAGVHRLQQVIPKNGNWFRGEPGTSLNGSRLLAGDGFSRDGSGFYYVDGQTQQGSTWGSPTGNLNNEHPEELFVNGYTRLIHVGSTAELAPGAWFFDYDNDRIYLYDDPMSFDSVETSVCVGAFAGTGITGVHIENLVIEKYASNQFGAIGYGDTGVVPAIIEWYTHDWTVSHCEVRYNHGGGIYVGPGMLVENCDVHHNGESGIAGQSYNADRGFTYHALVTVQDNYIHDNNLGFYGSSSEGGAGKFSDIKAGMIFQNNWVSNNHVAGPWLDVGIDLDPGASIDIRSNLIEGTDGDGVIAEISYGPIRIYWNEIRNNANVPSALNAGGPLGGAGIYVSNSSDVEVFQNWVYGSYRGITAVSLAGRTPHVSNLSVHDNDISVIKDWRTGISAPDGDDPYSTATFAGNIYRADPTQALWYWQGAGNTFAEWQSYGLDTDGQALPGTTGSLPAGAQGFQLSDYGPS